MSGWFNRPNPYSELIAPENQDRVRAELKIFFGPRAEIFLHTYEKICAKNVGRKRPNLIVWTWCWPAFLTAFVWYFYRKMYLFGAMIILLPIILVVVFGAAGSLAGLHIILTVFAKPFYVQWGLARIVKANKLGLTGEQRADYLLRAGGVSLPAGIFTGLLYAGATGLTLFELIQKFQGR